MTEVKDADLVRAFLGGDQDAFTLILRRYERPIFNLVYGMVNHYEDARDLTQQIFCKAALKLAQFDTRYRLFSWLYRIAINETLNFLQRTPRYETGELDGYSLQNPEGQLMTQEFETHLRQAITRLAPHYRALIMLKHFEGCSYSEISQLLQVSESTVKSRLFTGRRLLWQDLKNKGLLYANGRATQ